MRRILLSLIIGVLIAAPLGYAAARDLTVANLHATENIDAAGGISGGGYLNTVDATSGVSWLAGTVDPRGQFEASAGSLYTRRVGAAFPGTTGELWIPRLPALAVGPRIEHRAP